MNRPQQVSPTCLTCCRYVTIKNEKSHWKSDLIHPVDNSVSKCFGNNQRNFLNGCIHLNPPYETCLLFPLHLTLAACSPFCTIMNTSVQASFHIASSSFLPLSPFSTLSANTKIQMTAMWCTVGSGVERLNAVSAAVCCGWEWDGVGFLWSGMMPTLVPCVTKQRRHSVEETKDYFWSLFITSICNKLQHSGACVK